MGTGRKGWGGGGVNNGVLKNKKKSPDFRPPGQVGISAVAVAVAVVCQYDTCTALLS